MKDKLVTLNKRTVNILRAFVDWHIVHRQAGFATIPPPTRDELDHFLETYEDQIPARTTKIRYEKTLEEASMLSMVGDGVHRRPYLTMAGQWLVEAIGEWEGDVHIFLGENGDGKKRLRARYGLDRVTVEFSGPGV